MQRSHGASGDQPAPETVPDPAGSAAALFDALWRALVEAIGPTATAALLQRSIRRASASTPLLDGLIITRKQFTYAYQLPLAWSQSSPEAVAAVRAVVGELVPLLTEMTGQVVIRRLSTIPALAHCGLMPKDAR